VFRTINYSGGTSLYTGVPVLSDIRVTVSNQAGTLTSGFDHTNFVGDNSVIGPYFGGQAPLAGQLAFLFFPAFAYETFYLSHIGGPAGGTTVRTYCIILSVTFGPWVTGAVPVTGITSNVISANGQAGAGITMRLPAGQEIHTLSTGGGYVSVTGGLPLEYHTVTLMGENRLLSTSQDGVVTLVSPMRIDTSPALWGRLPGAAWLDLTFVPEPGTMLLLVTGVIALAVVGHRRMRR